MRKDSFIKKKWKKKDRFFVMSQINKPKEEEMKIKTKRNMYSFSPRSERRKKNGKCNWHLTRYDLQKISSTQAGIFIGSYCYFVL